MTISNYIKIAFVRLAAILYTSKRSKVIFYHDIHSTRKYTNMSTPIDLFKKHIKIIRESGYDIVNKITKKYGQIEICFDDAFLGLYDNIELIKQQNIYIHLFAISSLLGKKNHINKQKLIELNELQQITISSHTKTHKNLNKISIDDVRNELLHSKIELESILKKEVNSVCFPEGKFRPEVIRVAKECGYIKLYSSLPGFYNNKLFFGVIKRSLVQFAAAKEFKAIIKGGDHALSLWYTFKHFSR